MISRLSLFPLAGLAVASLILTACSDSPKPGISPMQVFTTTVTHEEATQTRTFTAVARARVETELGFRTAGKVVERRVEVGDSVKAGQVLARLDAADYQLAMQAAADQVQAATADARQAAADEVRFKRLLADGSVGVADHERQKARADAASARLDQAQRQLELARNRQGYATLVAPYAGVVTSLRFERGQVVAEGQPVAALAREGEREVVADLPEDWIGRVRRLSASAVPWSEPKASIQLVVREVSPVASPQGRTYRVRYAAAAGSQAQMSTLPLGSTVQLALSAAQPVAAAALLPVSALVKANGAPGVWALGPDGVHVVFSPVQVVAIDDANVHVVGLSAGSRVVSVGAHKLDAQMLVRPVERIQDASEASRGGSR